jgi:hypothetical protein
MLSTTQPAPAAHLAHDAGDADHADDGGRHERGDATVDEIGHLVHEQHLVGEGHEQQHRRQEPEPARAHEVPQQAIVPHGG